MENKNTKTVVFADLDGTILNDKYEYANTKQFVSELQHLRASIVLCSSKTQAEIEFYRKQLEITDPFIVENGGAVYIPKKYFPFQIQPSRQTVDYDIVEFGVPYSVLRKKLARVKKATDAEIVGFGDMTSNELAADSGLPSELAKLAKMRKYDEPFRLLEGNEKEVLNALEAEGLTCTIGGRYFHLLGNTDKGRAVRFLTDLYRRGFGRILTFGVGDSVSDLPMLSLVDVPLLVKKGFGGENANVVAWRNTLRLVTLKGEE